MLGLILDFLKYNLSQFLVRTSTHYTLHFQFNSISNNNDLADLVKMVSKNLIETEIHWIANMKNKTENHLNI